MTKSSKLKFFITIIVIILGIIFLLFANAKIRMIKDLNKVMDMRYIDNNDGTITDKITGLMWKKCSEGQSIKNECNDNATEFSSEEALHKFKSNNVFAGYSDWRIPSSSEMQTLIYCSTGKWPKIAYFESCGNKKDASGNYKRPTIYSRMFNNNMIDFYWVNNKGEINPGVNFEYGAGNWSYFIHPDTAYIRLVRSTNIKKYAPNPKPIFFDLL